MSNTNTEVLTTAYEKLQGAITQSNTVLPKLEEAVEKGNLDNYATVSDLEDIMKLFLSGELVLRSPDNSKWILKVDNYGQLGVIKEEE